jgi:hypothetical protein
MRWPAIRSFAPWRAEFHSRSLLLLGWSVVRGESGDGGGFKNHGNPCHRDGTPVLAVAGVQAPCCVQKRQPPARALVKPSPQTKVSHGTVEIGISRQEATNRSLDQVQRGQRTAPPDPSPTTRFLTQRRRHFTFHFYCVLTSTPHLPRQSIFHPSPLHLNLGIWLAEVGPGLRTPTEWARPRSTVSVSRHT